jgi:hypothetical protein
VGEAGILFEARGVAWEEEERRPWPGLTRSREITAIAPAMPVIFLLDFVLDEVVSRARGVEDWLWEEGR